MREYRYTISQHCEINRIFLLHKNLLNSQHFTALIEKEDEMNDELLRTEMNRNVRAKNQLQELGELVKARKNKSDE